MYDFEKAISDTEVAVSTTPGDHPSQAGRLLNLGNRLSDRYDRTGNMPELGGGSLDIGAGNICFP